MYFEQNQYLLYILKHALIFNVKNAQSGVNN